MGWRREVSFEVSFEVLLDVEEVELVVEKEFAGERLAGMASGFWFGWAWGGLAGRVERERGMAAARRGKRRGKRRVRSLMVRCGLVG